MLTKILGMLGWLGTALVLGAVAARFLPSGTPEMSSRLALAGLACVLLYLLGQWRDVAHLFSRRQAKLGAISSASILVVLGIIVAVNYVASRQNKRWDLTAAQQFSLSDQTRRVLAALDQPVQMKVFAREEEFDRFRLRLSEYQYLSDEVSVDYIDLDREPAAARQYDIQAYGTITVEYADRIERVTSNEEQDVTNALIKAVEGQQKKVYFIQGHGEKSPTASDREGYSSIRDALGRDNFEIDTLVLAQISALPDDASVLAIAGPKTDFLPQEIQLLSDFMTEGGKALFLIDPPESSEAIDLPNLQALLQEWNVSLGRDVVVDVSGMGQLLGTDASVPVAAEYPGHAITDRFSFMTGYPFARSVETTSGGEVSRVAQTFIQTSAQSWAEADIDRLTTSREIELATEEGDREGPISIGVAVTARLTPVEIAPGALITDDDTEAEDEDSDESDDPEDETPEPENEETRLAVIGDSDFAANYALGIQGNRDLFLNTVNWLAQQENLIAIRPKEPEDRRITMTADQQQRINLLAMFIIPGLVLVSGVFTWWQRR